jgi:hypothetical protein
LSGGIDTSDATATKNDIVDGVIAYVDGERIIGVLPVCNADDVCYASFKSLESMSQYAPYETCGTVTEDIVLRQNSSVTIEMPKDTFGDAQPADVAVGKTFTSSEGIKIPGTALKAQLMYYSDAKYGDDLNNISRPTKTSNQLVVTFPQAVAEIRNIAIYINDNSLGDNSIEWHLYEYRISKSRKLSSVYNENDTTFSVEYYSMDNVLAWSEDATTLTITFASTDGYTKLDSTDEYLTITFQCFVYYQ